MLYEDVQQFTASGTENIRLYPENIRLYLDTRLYLVKVKFLNLGPRYIYLVRDIQN